MNASGCTMAFGLTILGLTAALAGAGQAAAGGEDLIRQQAIAKVRGAAGKIGERTRHPALPRASGIPFQCLPTCDVTDGRFLVIAGSNLQTLSPPELDLQISVPAGATSFDLGVFDGDGGEYQSDGETSDWDAGDPALFQYTLYADPQATGSTGTPVELAPGRQAILSDSMPDDDWIDFTVPTGPEAASPSGNFFYLLKIRLLDPSLVTLNAFKVRAGASSGGLALTTIAGPFSYIAVWTGLSDILTVYPNFPSPSGTTYDGTFLFFFDVPVSQTQLSLWDGDFDHGNTDFTDQDTDDPDTPGAPFLPAWSTREVRPEGVATSADHNTGDPPDDAAGDFSEYMVRPPAVRYDLLFPDGRSFPNNNPSGNLEWEQFMISTAPFDRSQMDFHADGIPPGSYRLRIQGVDMLNLNALMVPYRVVGVDASGVPGAPLRPYLLGGTVSVAPGGGRATAGKGIPGVVLELRDWNGALLATAATDADGHYSFGVESGKYDISVAASNFLTAGSPLAGYVSTTGDRLSETVLADNAVTLDFSYRAAGSIGNRVWYDVNGNGLQDAGETGLTGVTLELRDAGGTLLETTVTGKDGAYTFSGLADGSYTVSVVPGSLPPGVAPSYDLDGTATPNAAVVVLTGGENRTDTDFGYRGVVCLTQPEIIQLQFVDAANRVLATITTTGDGSYTLPTLPAGTRNIRVLRSQAPHLPGR